MLLALQGDADASNRISPENLPRFETTKCSPISVGEFFYCALPFVDTPNPCHENPKPGERLFTEPIGSANQLGRRNARSQKAMVAVEVEKVYAEEAKQRQKGGQGGGLLVANSPQTNEGKVQDKAAGYFKTEANRRMDLLNIQAPSVPTEENRTKAT